MLTTGLAFNDGPQPRPWLGMNFCLFNNAWSTNYPEWSLDTQQRFRFNVTLAAGTK